MNWTPLNNEEQIANIQQKSFDVPQIIFKHSTRCSISNMALHRLEKAATPANTNFYYLDLLNNRNISNQIAEVFQVHHESPQVLLIHKGNCVYDESHSGINMQEIEEQISLLQP